METFIVLTLLITFVWVIVGGCVAIDSNITYDDINRLPPYKQYIIYSLLFSPQGFLALTMIGLMFRIIEWSCRWFNLDQTVSKFLKWLWEK